ncbi:MAG: hypothetical protein A3F42_08525 [Gammaproteobacteria bacterium RIFCSPHIGHO2_12_FULL_37_34]|nr:MAG: hypothetical protein A3F42_08525 [Gammaproteobacteria bacterium RIFCSPHIGHO2_12_FULL_37_34]
MSISSRIDFYEITFYITTDPFTHRSIEDFLLNMKDYVNKKLPNNNSNIYLLSYGGTIASLSEKTTDEFYNKPNINIHDLLSEISDITHSVNIHYEQVAQIMSHEMTHNDLLNLAIKINNVLQNNEVDGIVITQGTNCIEEAAYFVNLVINTEKPIVFTGALRPSNALGFDGYRNLYNSILLASSIQTRKIGVILTFNDTIHCARDATKKDPSSIIGLSSNDISMLGCVQGNDVHVSRVPKHKHTYCSEFSVDKILALPKVYVIYGHLGIDDIFVDAAVANGAVGIISAGMGKGYQSPVTTEALIKAVKKGVVVVRCSRTGNGYISRDPKLDDKYGFIVGGSLSPTKARLLLMVGLSQTNDKDQLQNYFYEY